jgi:hypothetical protein
MTLPTAAQTRIVPTVTVEEAALLAGFSGGTLAGWPIDAPQRDLVHGEAVALQWEMVQRACVAYASSPNRILQLQAFLVSQGYSAADAASVASSWVDVVLEVYQTPRLAATYATWTIPLVGSAPYTCDSTSTWTLQASDGTIFQAAQAAPLAATVGNAYKIAPTFQARNAGVSGNVIPGTIVKIMQAPAGIAIDLTATQSNLTPARGAENDVDALGRAQGRWGTLSGVLTRAGWRYVILTGVPTLTRCFVDDTGPGGPGTLGLALANAAGAATAAEVTAAQAIVALRAIAGMGAVSTAAAAQLTVAMTATLKTDGTNPLAAAQGASALAQLGPSLTGDVLYVDAVIAALMAVPGVINIPALSLAADIKRPAAGVIVLSPTVAAT